MEVKIKALFYKDLVSAGRKKDIDLLSGRRMFAKFDGTDKIVEITPLVYNKLLNDLFCIIDDSEKELLEYYEYCITVMEVPEKAAKTFFKDGVLNPFVDSQTREYSISTPPVEKEINENVIDYPRIKIYPSGKKRKD